MQQVPQWLKAIVCAALLVLPLQGQAQKPASLDDLLKQVRESAQQTSQANKQREARFLREKNRQGQLLAEAQAELARVDGRVNAVKSRYEVNQARIRELKAQLAARSGDYTALYGAAREAAADVRPVLADSFINAQNPKRLAALDDLAKNPALPSINALETLWFTLQQEMTEQGKTAQFRAKVVDPLGATKDAVVTRVGAFTAFADGDYLAIPKGGEQLRALSRQPSKYEQKIASDFAAATGTGAMLPVLIDPTRGGILALQVERPTIEERIHSGGWIGYVIIAVGIAGALLALFQLVYLLVVSRKVKSQLKDARNPRPNNPLGRVLRVFKDDAEAHDPEILELRLSEAVLRETPAIERFQPIIRLVIAAGPLLGLLGTVAGMIETFQVITEAGAGDPKLMAGGISKAMVATVLGLGIAIPLLFINAWLSSRSRALIQILDEQSAGLLAERLEQQRV